MSLQVDYSLVTKINKKNEAVAGIFRSDEGCKTDVTRLFVNVATDLLDTADKTSTECLKVNLKDLKAQTKTVMIAVRHDETAYSVVKPLATRLGLDH